jgi:hypothetical protein
MDPAGQCAKVHPLIPSALGSSYLGGTEPAEILGTNCGPPRDDGWPDRLRRHFKASCLEFPTAYNGGQPFAGVSILVVEGSMGETK